MTSGLQYLSHSYLQCNNVSKDQTISWQKSLNVYGNLQNNVREDITVNKNDLYYMDVPPTDKLSLRKLKSRLCHSVAFDFRCSHGVSACKIDSINDFASFEEVCSKVESEISSSALHQNIAANFSNICKVIIPHLDVKKSKHQREFRFSQIMSISPDGNYLSFEASKKTEEHYGWRKFVCNIKDSSKVNLFQKCNTKCVDGKIKADHRCQTPNVITVSFSIARMTEKLMSTLLSHINQAMKNQQISLSEGYHKTDASKGYYTKKYSINTENNTTNIKSLSKTSPAIFIIETFGDRNTINEKVVEVNLNVCFEFWTEEYETAWNKAWNVVGIDELAVPMPKKCSSVSESLELQQSQGLCHHISGCAMNSSRGVIAQIPEMWHIFEFCLSLLSNLTMFILYGFA